MCRSTALRTFLDFGVHPHSDGFIREECLSGGEYVFPLACCLCKDCGQVQLTYTVKPEHLYNEDYVYDASVTATGRKHFTDMAKEISQRMQLKPESFVIDIGSNVGLLLSGFQECGMRVLGIDPAVGPTSIAMERGIDTVVKCFSADVAAQVASDHGKASVITGTNAFAHLDDLDDCMQGIDALLDEHGVFVIEAPYIVDLLKQLEYDTIYHQHLSYLSIKPLKQFFTRHNMELFDVEHQSIHGGSIRLWVGRTGKHEIQPIVDDLIDQETQMGIHTVEYLEAFAQKVAAHKEALMQMLDELKRQGKRVVGVGAPAKGMTLLNYCNIGRDTLDYLTEKSAWKIGRFSPGMNLPIVSDDELLKDPPDYALILAWNFAPEIMRNLAAYKEKGGSFIIPIPTPEIV